MNVLTTLPTPDQKERELSAFMDTLCLKLTRTLSQRDNMLIGDDTGTIIRLIGWGAVPRLPTQPLELSQNNAVILATGLYVSITGVNKGLLDFHQATIQKFFSKGLGAPITEQEVALIIELQKLAPNLPQTRLYSLNFIAMMELLSVLAPLEKSQQESAIGRVVGALERAPIQELNSDSILGLAADS